MAIEYTKRSIILQDRDRQVLQFIERFHIATVPTLACAPFFRETQASHEAVKTVTKRLRQAGLIQSAPLFGKRTIDQLTSAGAALCGAHPSLARPIPPQAKVRAYAVLAFCCQSDPIRLKLTPDEFSMKFSELHREGEPINYYVDHAEGRPRLGFIQVDFGRMGRWDRVFDRIERLVTDRCVRQAYRDLVQAKRFVVTLVTATHEKAEWLRHQLPDRNLSVSVQVEVVEDLINLFAPPRSSRRP